MTLTFQEAKISREDGVWLCLRVKEPALASEFILKKQDRLYDCEIKQHRDKRSLEANAYCWALLDKLADALRTTKEELYLQKVREIGPYKDFTLTEDEARTFRVAWEKLGTGWPTEQVDYDRDGDRVVIIEDVTTSGKSIEETFPIIQAQGNVEIKGLMVSLNRMERGKGTKSALEEIQETYGFPANAIVTMEEVIEYLYNKPCQGKVIIDDTMKAAIDAYYAEYGAQ